MFYREYKPTCVETLFGKPPPKFKAKVIVPETQNLNLDLRQCKCSFCSKYNQRTKTNFICCNSSSSDCSIKCAECCKVCKKRYLETKNKKKNSIGRMAKDKFKDRYFNNRMKEIKQTELYECRCSSYCELDDKEENYNKGRRRVTKGKIVKKTKLYAEPECSVCEAEEREGMRFCSICKQWESITESRPVNDGYSSRAYENFDNEVVSEQHGEAKEGENCTQVSHFVIESCNICGRGQAAVEEKNQRRDDSGQDLGVTPDQSSDLCEMGRVVEECTRREGFFTVTPRQNVEPSKSVQRGERMTEERSHKEAAVCTEEEITLERCCKFCEEEGSLPQTCETKIYIKPKDEGLNSNSRFKKAYSSSALQNLEKEYNNFNEEHLEEYKQQLMAELREPIKNGNKQTKFRPCNCEHSRKYDKDERRKGLEIDEHEIKTIREKCNEALAKVDQCKKEIAKNNEMKCKCDHESTIMIVEDFKGRCDQLERQVTKLQQALNYYAQNNRSKEQDVGENGHGRRISWGRERSKGSPAKDEEWNRWKPMGAIKVSCSGPRIQQSKRKDKQRTKSRCPSPRNRRVTCHHMRCYPPEQLADIPSFKDCPGFPDFALQFASGRRMI